MPLPVYANRLNKRLTSVYVTYSGINLSRSIGQSNGLQSILDPRSYAHPLMAVQHQSPQIEQLLGGQPDRRKTVSASGFGIVIFMSFRGPALNDSLLGSS